MSDNEEMYKRVMKQCGMEESNTLLIALQQVAHEVAFSLQNKLDQYQEALDRKNVIIAAQFEKLSRLEVDSPSITVLDTIEHLIDVCNGLKFKVARLKEEVYD